jgi:hypothetical protein
MSISAERVREVLNYDPETGLLTWKAPKAHNVSIGDVAGYINRGGYRRISVDDKEYQAHRLAWLYVHGSFPAALLDHINGDRADNRIANLRNASSSENHRNSGMYKNNTTGFKGVAYHAHSGRWRAETLFNGVRRSLGYYPSAEEAGAAYQAFAKANFGEFYRETQ